MKTLIANIAKTIAYVGITPLLPFIAITWIGSLLFAGPAAANEEFTPSAQNHAQAGGYRTESQIIMLNATA